MAKTNEKSMVGSNGIEPGFARAKRWELRSYSMLRRVVEIMDRTYFSMRSEFESPLPDGPFILAPVHRSNIDSFLLGALTRRRIRFMGKDSLWNVPIVGAVITVMGGFPVHRGIADREALRRCLLVLSLGEPLVLFPEGQRRQGPVIADLHEGSAYLAIRAKVPIVPVGIAGSDLAMGKGNKFPRHRPTFVVVGSPLYPSLPGEDVTKTTAVVSRRAVKQLNAELTLELQRLYDKSKEMLALLGR